MDYMRAVGLFLGNKLTFKGFSFGYEGYTDGEVVFSTAMTGYPEAITDPSYSGQILCLTCPIVGNYGISPTMFESDGIHIRGLIISDYSAKYSHWKAVKSLDEWLKEFKIPGIFGVDTREIAKYIRNEGSMSGAIVPEGVSKKNVFYDPDIENQVAKVSCREVISYGRQGGKKVVLLDCGVRKSIIKYLSKYNIEIIRVPWDYDFNQMQFDGLLISGGPGNPDYCGETVMHIKKCVNNDKPVFGISMGNELLAKAAGIRTYKLKYGHRSDNYPVRLVGTSKCCITSQNHGYAVNDKGLGGDWEPWFINMNDGTNEGIRHKSGRFFSVQFYPETSDYNSDTGFLFDEFINLL